MQTSSSPSTSTITLPPNSILYGGEKNKGAVSLADLLERRTHGLTEPETWALLCQAVQALQDLFLSGKVYSTCNKYYVLFRNFNEVLLQFSLST